MSDYAPYSENLKCKWCLKRIMDHLHDRQCDGCWEFVTRLDYALNIPSLFKLIKEKIEKRSDEIREKENIDTGIDLGEAERKLLSQSIKEAEVGDVVSLEEAEKESFKESEN